MVRRRRPCRLCVSRFSETVVEDLPTRNIWFMSQRFKLYNAPIIEEQSDKKTPNVLTILYKETCALPWKSCMAEDKHT